VVSRELSVLDQLANKQLNTGWPLTAKTWKVMELQSSQGKVSDDLCCFYKIIKPMITIC